VTSGDVERSVHLMFEAQNVSKMQYCCLDEVACYVLEMLFENGLRGPKFHNQVVLLDAQLFVNT
jgi:hypothetical protein